MKERRRLACRSAGGPPAYLLLVLFFAASALAHPGIGIVMDSRGNVFYTDLKHVWKIAPDGTKSIAVRNVHTHELSIDPEDNLFGEHLWYEGDATKKWGHRVWRLGRDGKLTDIIPAREGFLTDYSFVRDPAGNMYWVDRDRDNRLMKRAPGGGISSIARKAGVRDVRWLTVTPDGTVYLIDLLDIRRITPQGRINTIARNLAARSLSQFHVGERHLLMGIWTDRSRHVYVASYGTREVKKILPDGRVEVVARSSAPYSPTGGLIAPNGDLWLLEYSGPIPDRVRVRRMTPGGRSRTF